jgi:hypothetical protein
VPRRLLSQPFLGQLHQILAPHGVAAFNFYGDPAGAPARAFAAELHAEFGNVRCSNLLVDCRCTEIYVLHGGMAKMDTQSTVCKQLSCTAAWSWGST